ncbi:MAG: activator of HSP90 ATPase [Bdellovibrio sp. ArHS]|uniref:SRPBCC family protein n=1 Tax=Bdellovibrio sp. ArHS TaxID=1569284 RepID=UPI000583CE3B|nr:SRPBCC family protein [Bdellovibrio sp. ArHS]KHD87851.1 MAG: activator of HSP90 ATPase [Bdellovibrio sp. ArHS]
MGFNKIKIEATVRGDRSQVWEAWTKPEHITKWNFATDSWCCPWAENDLRVGGKYSARMEAKDGSFGFDFEGVYQEVTPYSRLVFVMPDGRSVATEFADEGGQTRITTVFDAETQNSEEMQKNGWQAILNNFKGYFEGL